MDKHTLKHLKKVLDYLEEEQKDFIENECDQDHIYCSLMALEYFYNKEMEKEKKNG